VLSCGISYLHLKPGKDDGDRQECLTECPISSPSRSREGNFHALLSGRHMGVLLRNSTLLLFTVLTCIELGNEHLATNTLDVTALSSLRKDERCFHVVLYLDHPASRPRSGKRARGRYHSTGDVLLMLIC
jgi:hypothetical protein